MPLFGDPFQDGWRGVLLDHRTDALQLGGQRRSLFSLSGSDLRIKGHHVFRHNVGQAGDRAIGAEQSAGEVVLSADQHSLAGRVQGLGVPGFTRGVLDPQTGRDVTRSTGIGTAYLGM